MTSEQWNLVFGPPGTGKTTELLRIVEEALAAGVKPENIGYVGFTRRAAYEARDRAATKFGLAAKPPGNAARSLRQRREGDKVPNARKTRHAKP